MIFFPRLKNKEVALTAENPLLEAAEPLFVLLHEWHKGIPESSRQAFTETVEKAFDGFSAKMGILGLGQESVQAAKLLLNEVFEQSGLVLSAAIKMDIVNAQGLSLPRLATPEVWQFFHCCIELRQTGTLAGRGAGGVSVISDPGGRGLVANLPQLQPLSPSRFNGKRGIRRGRRSRRWAVVPLMGMLLLAAHDGLDFSLDSAVEPLFVELQYFARPQDSGLDSNCLAGQSCGEKVTGGEGAVTWANVQPSAHPPIPTTENGSRP